MANTVNQICSVEYDSRNTRIRELKEELLKVQAVCAEMREVLTTCLFDRSDHLEPDQLDARIIHATSNDAGKGYIAKVVVVELATELERTAKSLPKITPAIKALADGLLEAATKLRVISK